MEPSVDITKAQEQAQDIRRRKGAGWFAAVVVFALAYLISIASFHDGGLALGWLPSAFLAAAVGWITYCFPWLIDVVAFLLELLVAALG